MYIKKFSYKVEESCIASNKQEQKLKKLEMQTKNTLYVPDETPKSVELEFIKTFLQSDHDIAKHTLEK